ncbi:MAG: N-6 DNA methylase [Ktedonobacteraceae bacterium]
MQEVHEEQVSWYEATLSLNERKSRGHFSTPPLLVERILDACGYTSDANLSDIRILDPACGSGNFLAGAARRLLAYGARSNIARHELPSLLQRNIWGFDPDPVSCFLAAMQLNNIVQSPVPTPWHIHQADGLVFPWTSDACVDLFLANPPYLAAKNTDLSGYRSAQQRGQVDSYLLFLNLGLQIVRPHGWLGLVLPDPVLARANAAKERAHLLKACTIHHLWHISGVFAAHVGAVVIVAQKCPARSTHQVAWLREKWGTINTPTSKPIQPNETLSNAVSAAIPRTSTVNQSLFMRQPAAELRYLLGSAHTSTIQLLHAYLAETSSARHNFAPLSDFLSLRRGEELGRKSPLLVNAPHLQLSGHAQNISSSTVGVELASTLVPTPTHDPAILVPTSTYDHAPTPEGTANSSNGHQAWYPVLRGGCDMRPYAASFNGYWIAREAILKPLERYLTPKLLVVKSTDRLQAALDTQGHIALQTLYVLHAREHEANLDDLYFFLALLNSRLLQQYVYVLHTAYKWVQPQIEQHVLARLPIPLVEASIKQQISMNARQLVAACSEQVPVVEWKEYVQRMYEEQERTICALYKTALTSKTSSKRAG